MKGMRLFGVALAVSMALAAGTAAYAASSGPVSSSLSKGTLNTSIWTVIGQDSNLSMTAHPGWMTILTQHLPVATYGTGLKDMVLQPTNPSSNWTVSVETTYFGLSYGPPPGTSSNYQGGGIYAFQDSTHWVRVQRQALGCDLAVQMDDGSWGSQTGITYANGGALPNGTATENAAPGSAAFNVACNSKDDPLWLRLTKTGDVYTGYYSTNGSTWVQLQSFAWPSLQVKDVGLTANEGGNTFTPVPFGFKDFTVGATTATAATTTSTTAKTSSSTGSSAKSPTSTSASTSGSALPKTGESPLVALLGMLLIVVGTAATVTTMAARARSSRS